MRIGELAALAGTTTDAIRFYEKVGLLTSRRLPNGYRDFSPAAVQWLHYISIAQRLGFSLAEIARNGERLRNSPDAAPELSALFQEKIEVIDARLADLAAMRDDLAARVDAGCPMRGSGAAAELSL